MTDLLNSMLGPTYFLNRKLCLVCEYLDDPIWFDPFCRACNHKTAVWGHNIVIGLLSSATQSVKQIRGSLCDIKGHLEPDYYIS